MISGNLPKMIAEAMKARDTVRLSTLRLLSSAFNYEKIDKQHELTEEEELAVIKKQAKQRRDSIEAYKKAGSPERAEGEAQELKILEEFLPPEISDADLEKIVLDAIKATNAREMSDLGKVIGLVKSKAPDADGGRVAAIVKNKLNIGG
jgi:uncharacterized protein YqeY